MAKQLVDIDISARVISSETEIDADMDLDVFRDALRLAMAEHTKRGWNDEAATVLVTVKVTPVGAAPPPPARTPRCGCYGGPHGGYTCPGCRVGW